MPPPLDCFLEDFKSTIPTTLLTTFPFLLSNMASVPFLGCMEKNSSSAMAAILSLKTPAAFTTTLGLIQPLLVFTSRILSSLLVMDRAAVFKDNSVPFSMAFSIKAMVTL